MVLGQLDGMDEAAAEALLGALDPARNHRFRDRYMGLRLDLMSPAAGYTDAEKQRIATAHLRPAPARAARVVRR